MRILRRRLGKRTSAHKLVVECEMRTLGRACSHRASNELPSPFGEEPVIRPGHDASSVSQRDPVSRFDHAPMRKYTRLYITPIPALAYRAVDIIPNTNLSERARAAVGHQNTRVARHAVHATML